ncbi:hypothetical protein B0H15DRAFT_849841 [Mycena belliarum]|uniref:Uncharacterized protein n=1 Tax=Mycena belliarum TaxID=1033014 RepID=A0AAD6XSD4_9AGAR|nr:hypothetical protein B0H15DRAFT_849841 [Mycena belliae]
MALLSEKRATRNFSPAEIWRLFLPQSITWLRLVVGNWLFVASSDNHTSKISCWDMSLVFQGYTEPIAEAYLPGQVKTGELEIQNSGIVLALGLGPGSLAVHIITLSQRAGVHVFSELYRAEGSSHVLLLSGHLVGCAQRHGAIIPHLINWRDRRIHNIPPPPGGLDVPGRRSVPHLMVVWSGILVIIRSTSFEFYNLFTPAGDAIAFAKLIAISSIWEAVICDLHAMDAVTVRPLRLIVLSPRGVEMFVIDPDVLAPLDEERTCVRVCIAKPSPFYDRWKAPWYHLCVSQSGRRILWLSVASNIDEGSDGPQLLSMAVPFSMPVPLLPTGPESLCIWSKIPGDSPQPALWALPALDFDDALGLTVVGNCFGELAIYDQYGRNPELCGALGADFTAFGSRTQPLLPTKPVLLGLDMPPCSPIDPPGFDLSLFTRWSQDDIVLGEPWRTDWVTELSAEHQYCQYSEWHMWTGAPSDFAWQVEHAYGFPGPVVPQAYAYSDRAHQYLLLRAGDQYLAWIPGYAVETELRSWPNSTLPQYFTISHSQPEFYVRQTALMEGAMYTSFRRTEEERGRNRWAEQMERGGGLHRSFVGVA